MVTGENVGQIAAEAIRKGAMDYVVKFGDYLFTIPLVVEKNLTVAKLYKENEKLRVELERALEEKRRKNAQLEESLKMVEELAATDALTGLVQPAAFQSRAGSAVRRERPHGQRSVVRDDRSGRIQTT